MMLGLNLGYDYDNVAIVSISQLNFRNGILVAGIVTMIIALFGLVYYTSDEVLFLLVFYHRKSVFSFRNPQNVWCNLTR